MLKKSKYNILLPLKNSEKKMIANSLYGTADILDTDEITAYRENRFDTPIWMERGYAVDPESEQQEFQRQYMNFLDERDSDEIQLFFVPTYACNFGCEYCYQYEYTPSKIETTTSVVDAFFAYVEKEFAGKRKYCTLFGGEPLLPSDAHQRVIAYFLTEADKRNLETAIVTNGYHLSAYLPVLQNARIREIQVTLDGMRDIHNRRRPLKNGSGTFDEIVAGIDQLLEANISVNLRMVVDRSNINDLPKLAQFAIDKGWTSSSLFKTQLGRNYELHSCQKNSEALYSRVQMYADLADLIDTYPHILQFHKPSFHFVKALHENGELPAALFDSCPGCKTEWAFDYQGKIFSCTATVGKADEQLGTFYPTVSKQEETILEWQDRDILAIDKCRECHLALVCGGGCGSLAKNSNGALHTPDCRPVQEIAEIGAGAYFSDNTQPVEKK
ncbi:MAG: radical SAM protein [Deltaproteobacteria bacterium]|nr:radical SAM protein [Deltaproteobacteria bacterium]MBN2672463.1 radical SAM protein [Deltaproteobacteria bacterium]